eukprot:scaffold1190_cov187-Ochromonas_danica.AAC.33
MRGTTVYRLRCHTLFLQSLEKIRWPPALEASVGDENNLLYGVFNKVIISVARIISTTLDYSPPTNDYLVSLREAEQYTQVH